MRKSVKVGLLSLSLILFVTLAVKGYVLQVATGTWATESDLGAARSGASAALLKDGRVLVTGGDSPAGTLASAELIGLDATSSSAAAMGVSRSRHVSALLPGGKVLVAGGTTTGGGATNAAEIYDPITDSWTPVTGGMSEARANAAAVVLLDGRVLIAGGDKSGVASVTLEIFDPATSSFSFAGVLSSPRTELAVALLPDGRVLVAGGSNGSNALNSTDIFDPAASSVTAGPVMSSPRSGLSATAMLDGRVLLAGGSNGSADLASAEIFDPVMVTMAPAASSLVTARQGQQAFLLPNNNNVLIVGGTSAGLPLASAELYTPWLGTFAATGPLSSARTLSAGSPMRQDGLLVIAGGQDATGVAVATKDLYGFATVKTDAADYPPGTTVNITGSGWKPGETVNLTLVESPNLDTHGPYTVVADSNGSISDSSFVTDEHDLNISFLLTAAGSATQAQNTFKDSKPNTVTVGAQSPASLVPGGSAQYTVTVSFNGSGSSCTSPLSIQNPAVLPAGALASFNPTSVTSTSGNINSTLTITTTNATPPGSFNFTVLAGNGGGTCQAGTATNTGTLQVTENTATSLSSSLNPSVFGQSITLTASVTQTAGPTTPNAGIVTFKDGTTTLGTASLNSSGQASITPSALTSGSHSLTATYGGTTSFSSSTSNTLSQTVNQAATTTAVTSSLNPSNSGQSVTFTATVAPVSPGAGTPSGSVTFKDGPTTLGSATLSGGSATLSTSALTIATHSVTATYNGDTNFTGSTSSILSQVVNQAGAVVTVTSNANPSAFGQIVTFSVAVAPSSGTGTPTGSVTLKDGTVTLATLTLSNGQASFGTSTLTVGTHSITAAYGGDNTFTASISSALPQVVAQAATSTAQTSTPNPSVFGQSVAFTVTVSATAPGAGVPTGTVTLQMGSTTEGSGTLVNGVATIQVSTLPVGTSGIKASYSGDTNFSSSQTQSALSQVVTKGASTTAVSSNANPSLLGVSVTFTATVSASGAASGTPSGTVTFKDGATTLATSALNASGIATFSSTTLSAGAHTITAVYNSDANFSGSTSQPLTQTVNQAPVITSANSTTFATGSAGSFTVTATGFPTPTFTESGALPSGVSFNTSTGVLSGTPAANTGGTYPITFGATNGISPNASQSFTLTVNNPTPTITTLSPANANLSDTLNVVLTGSNFINGVTAASFGPGITVNSTVANSSTQITANITVSSAATPGLRSVSVTNPAPGGGTATLSNSFTVNNPATSTLVTSSLNPSTYGAAVSFTAAVSAASGVPTGAVAFYDGGSCATPGSLLAGPSTLDGAGKAFFSTATLAAGSHTVVGCYSPTGIYLASGSSVTQVVNQAQATLSFDNLTFTYDGAPKPVTVTTSPSGLAGVTILYNGAATPPVNAGTIPVSASLTNPNYTATPLSATETVQTALAMISIVDPMPTYDGNPHGATISVVPANLSVLVTYNGSASLPTAAGSYVVSAVVNDANYAGAADGTLTILQAKPVVTWNNPADISFGTPLSGTQLNAAANVPGTFTYTPASGTVLNAGDGQTLSADFSPTDSVDYSTVLGTHVTINVKAAPLYVISSDGTRAFGQGNPQFTPAFIGLTDGDTATSVGAVTCQSIAAAASAPGTYAATCSGVSSSNYTVKYIPGTLSVTNPLSVITEIKGNSSSSETLTIGQSDTLTATGKFADASSRSLSIAGGSSFALATLPTPVSGAAMAEAGGVLYAIGGFDGANTLKTIQAYDPKSNSWTVSSAALTTARRDAAMASVAGKIFVIGGKNSAGTALADIEVLDTTGATPSVSTYPASLTTARSLAGAAAFNSKIYVVAGTDTSNNSLSTVETFDLITGNVAASDPGNAFSQASAAIITKNNAAKLYVAGVSGSSVTLVAFDGSTWGSPVSTTLDGAQAVGAASSAESLYLINGSGVWSYDGVSLTQKNNLFNPHNGTQPVAIGSLIYLASANSASPNSTLDAFAPDELKWTSADATKATVDQAGKITALAITDPGAVTITAASLNNPAITADFLLTVIKKTQTIQFGVLSAKTYGDSDFSVSATSIDSTSTPTGLLVTFSAGSGDACSVGASTLASGVSSATVHITGAGSCTITAAQSGDDTTWQPATSVPQSFTIAKANPLVVVTPYSTTYDGNPHTATGTATGVKSESLTGLDLSGTIHTSAGDYPSDPWSFTDTTGNYNNASGTVHDAIAKADPLVTAVGGTFTYDGNPHAGSATATGVQNEPLTPVNIAYKDSSSNLLTTPPVNAGTYSVAARFAGNGNYNPKQSAAVPLVIKQASAVISVTAYSVTYDGNPHTATGTAHGVETPTPVDLAALLHLTATTHTDAGNYSGDAWTFDGNNNYLPATGTVADSIAKADSATALTCPASVTFDGNPQTPCSALATGAGGLNATVPVIYSNNTGAGSASANASYPGDTNHNPSSDSKTFTINRAPSSTVITCPASVTFDGTAQTPCSAAATGVAGLNTPVTINYVNNTFAGTATANAAYPGDTNHLSSSDSKTFVINKAASSTTITCPASVTFNGSPQTPCSAVATGAGALSVNVQITYVDNLNAGTATGNAAFPGDDNHLGSSDTRTFLINQAASSTAVTCPASLPYNGTIQKPCTVAVTGIGGLSLTPAATYSNNLNAGLASASYSYSGDINHTASSDSKNFTIAQVPLVITASSAPMVYGGAVPPITAGYSGFVTMEGPANLATLPTCGTAATSQSPVSAYISSCAGAASLNYAISYANGVVTVTPATTTTTVTSSLNPSNWGQVATFVATVAPQFSGMPTGSITFYNAPNGATCQSLAAANASPLDTMQLSTVGSNQQASTSNAWLPVGNDTLLACYNGDTNFIGGNGSVSQTVIAAPIAVLAPASLSFGNQQGGTVSGPQTLTISNPQGTAPLLISSIKLAGTNPGYFTESDSCSSVPVGPVGCTITIKFAPPANSTGVATATVVVTDNDENASGSTQSSQLTGAGVSSINSVGSLSTYGLFATANGCSSINMSGNAIVDSFNSGASNNAGNVGTNGNASLSGNPVINGAVYSPVAVSGSCSTKSVTGLSTSGKAQATGGLKALAAPITYPAPPAPLPAPPATAQNISGSCGTVAGCSSGGAKIVNLAPGQYGNVSISGGTTTRFSAGVYNVNSLTLTGNSIFAVDASSGPVVVNLSGAGVSGGNAVLDLTGGVMSNATGQPAKLQFYYAGTQPVKLSGNTASYATVYAPNAPINLSGGSHFYGAITGGTVNNSGGTAIHYDASLPNIPAGDYLWFNSAALNVKGLPASGSVKIYVTNASINFPSAAAQCSGAFNATTNQCVLPVPNAVVTFSSTATTASTTWDAANNRWSTLVPTNGNTALQTHAFIDGLAYLVPAAFPNGLQNVTWSAAFSTSTTGVSFSWQWGAAVYSSFNSSNATLNVNPVDNADPAGTPEAYKSSVVLGATGPGYIGLYTGAAGVVPTIAEASVAPSSLDFTVGGTVAQSVGTTSASMTAVLTNNTSGPLAMSSVQLTGSNPGDFVQTNNCPMIAPNNTLPSGGTCTITVTFAPTTTGKRTAKVVVNDSANNTPQTVFLKGTGQ